MSTLTAGMGIPSLSILRRPDRVLMAVSQLPGFSPAGQSPAGPQHLKRVYLKAEMRQIQLESVLARKSAAFSPKSPPMLVALRRPHAWTRASTVVPFAATEAAQPIVNDGSRQDPSSLPCKPYPILQLDGQWEWLVDRASFGG
jgi:hypothetical protein